MQMAKSMSSVYFILTNGVIWFYSYRICSLYLSSMSTHNGCHSTQFWRTRDISSSFIYWQANMNCCHLWSSDLLAWETWSVEFLDKFCHAVMGYLYFLCYIGSTRYMTGGTTHSQQNNVNPFFLRQWHPFSIGSPSWKQNRN